MRKFSAILIAVMLSVTLFAQTDTADAKAQYQAEQRVIGRKFSAYFYPNYSVIYSLPEKVFLFKIDSARAEFEKLLRKYKERLARNFVADEEIAIKYYFDRLIIDYPSNHETYTATTIKPSPAIQALIKKNLPDLNKPALLSNTDLRDYVRAFFHFLESEAHKKGLYRNTDNLHLRASWDFISNWITDPRCATAWKYEYLYNHIDNYGIKNIDPIYRDFISNCSDTAYLNKITTLYAADSTGRADHLVRTYKTAGPFELDMHIFLPDTVTGKKSPAIVYFHGGSWSEGKPDWFFSACKSYAKQGWVACAVEYRISGRHGSLPFQSVMDARSAIRWLRKNAPEFNIDTSKIIASGNSAGGHLVLSTALADKWNEKSDDLSISPVPNVLLVNAGVYDLTDDKTAWIRKGLKDPNTVKEISPNHSVKKNMPPTLLIHGSNDRNVPFATAKTFEQEMKKAGNNFEFHALENAGHFIWFEQPYASQVSKLRSEFLKKLGY